MVTLDTILKRVIMKQDDEHDHEVEEGSAVLAKTIAMCVLFLASFTLGIVPIQLSKWFNWQTNPKNNIIVNLLLCFGGGVLLATTFLHLLPEVAEQISKLETQEKLPEFPFHLAEVLMCTGFFVMYLVEELVHFYLHRQQHDKKLNTLSKTYSIRRGEKYECATISANDLVKNMEEANTKNESECTHSHSHIGHSHLVNEDSLVRSIRGLLVVLALSVHELFEGLAVGLESSPSTVWYMFGAVSAHKLVIAFCIGVELITIQTNRILSVIYVFTFAVVSPMGIGIGIAISDDSSTVVSSVILQGLASGTLLYIVFFEIIQRDQSGGLKQYLAILVGFLVMFGITMICIGMGIALNGTGRSEQDITSIFLQGMAAGTLLYVVFFEVLSRERNKNHSGLLQLVAILVGFGVMFSLQIAIGHEHSHDHSHHETVTSTTHVHV